MDAWFVDLMVFLVPRSAGSSTENQLKVSFWTSRLQAIEGNLDNINHCCICTFLCFCSSGATPQPNRQVSGDTMTLRSVTTLNNGVYQCNASNQYGYLLANAFVNVLRELPLCHPWHNLCFYCVLKSNFKITGGKPALYMHLITKITHSMNNIRTFRVLWLTEK